MSDRPKFIIYDKREGLLESVLSDATTFFGLAFCIMVSDTFDGGRVWQVVTLGMFFAWLMIRMPWERATRTVKLRGKKEAVEWAHSLPDDA